MEEQREIVAYSYMRDGVLYHTTNENIASLRSDTGTYNVEYGNVIKQEQKKEEK
jgi:hypothetical protein